jgi:hypothetical protein
VTGPPHRPPPATRLGFPIVTAAPVGGRVAALLGALLARPGDSRRRLALAAVLVLVGGALALCCCVDGPEHSAAGSATAAVAAEQHAAALPSGASAQVDEHADQQVGGPERCGSPATSGEASPASTGRAVLTAAGALAVVAAAQPISSLLTGARTQLLGHLPAQVSPYRLCVMRT